MIHAPVFVLVSVAIELDPISSEWENQSPMRQSPYKMSNHRVWHQPTWHVPPGSDNYNPKVVQTVQQHCLVRIYLDT